MRPSPLQPTHAPSYLAVQVLDPQLHAFLEERDCLHYFFAFRWLIIHWKREFSFEQVRLDGQTGGGEEWEGGGDAVGSVVCYCCRQAYNEHLMGNQAPGTG